MSLPPLIAKPTSAQTQVNWRRRTIELLVALLAFAVWGKLAYIGGFRLLARSNGIALGGSWALDVLSLVIGVSGSIAGVSAIWALSMKALGRTPKSIVGAPDDSPDDYPQAGRTNEHPVERD